MDFTPNLILSGYDLRQYSGVLALFDTEKLTGDPLIPVTDPLSKYEKWVSKIRS